MHKLLIIFCMFIASTYFVFALDYDIIHLKDGNAIQGIIIEIIVNNSVKINVGAVIYTYQMSDIDNISFASRQDNSYLSSEQSRVNSYLSSEPSRAKYKGIFEVGCAVSVSNDGNNYSKVNLINGINFNNKFSLGFGIGINSYINFNCNYVPIFIDLRIPFGDSKQTVFFIFDGGYNIYNLSNYLGKYKSFYNFGIGFNYEISNNLCIDISLTYDLYYYQYTREYNIYYLYNMSHYSNNVSSTARCISLNMGIDF